VEDRIGIYGAGSRSAQPPISPIPLLLARSIESELGTSKHQTHSRTTVNGLTPEAQDYQETQLTACGCPICNSAQVAGGGDGLSQGG